MCAEPDTRSNASGFLIGGFSWRRQHGLPRR